MASELFVDTSAWFVLVSPGEKEHSAMAGALRHAIARSRRVVTTNLIVAETHALLMRRLSRDVALGFVREVRRDPIIVVESTKDLEERARRDWLERFDDHDFSFADAVSFTVMSERGIRGALALDHHFTVAGFEVVP